MIAETIKAIIDFLKLAPTYLAAIALIAGFLLFLPSNWLDFLGVQNFSIDYRPWLGLAFIVSAGICIITIAKWISKSVIRAFRKRRIRYFIIDKLHRLTEEEKQILRYYFAKGTTSNTLRVDDGVVQELVACRIIYRSAQIGSMVEGFSHNINDFSFNYICSNPSILQGTTNTYRTDKRETYW